MSQGRVVQCATLLVILTTVRSTSSQGPRPAHDWSAPTHADARTNPLAARTDTLAGGKRLFHERCAVCHGEDGRGTPKAPDLRDIHVAADSDGALFWKISSGNSRTGMPGFSFLPEPQRWQLVQHLRILQSPKAP